MPSDSPTAEQNEPVCGPALYVVGTPIGNRDDITLRALKVLRGVDLVAAEDTRRTGRLLAALGIKKPLVSCHEHNERRRAVQIVNRLEKGDSVALVSDAGSPALSDPGRLLVADVLAAGFKVVPIPGVSAVSTALSVAGLPGGSYLFAGFVSRQKNRRLQLLEALAAEGRTVIFFESPQRIRQLLEDVRRIMGNRPAVLAREMTKLHEEFIHGTLAQIMHRLEARGKILGEITLLVGPAVSPQPPDLKQVHRELAKLAGNGDLSLSEAVRRVAGALNVSRNTVYREALKLKKDASAESPPDRSER